MSMGVPMAQGSPSVIQGTATPAGPWYNVTISLQVDQKSDFERKRKVMPDPIKAKGVTQTEWETIMDHFDAFKQKNFFYSCPSCECVYWCCPGLCLQTALCFCNPVTWIVCINPSEAAKKPCEAAVNEVLRHRGLAVKILDNMMDMNEGGGYKASIMLA